MGWNYLMMWLFLCPNMVCPFSTQPVRYDRIAPLDQCCTNCHRLVDRPNTTICMDGLYHHLQYVHFVPLYLGLFSRCSLSVVSVNCLGIRVFGELEFWFSSIKVITLIGLIIFGIIIGQLVSSKNDTRLSYSSVRSWRQSTW